MKKIEGKENMFSTGNIILGVIIIILIGSLFFDFFGGKTESGPVGCPIPIANLIVTNVMYSGNEEIYTESRVTKPRINPDVEYKISALLRNIGKEDITITSLLLTEENLGIGDVLDIEPIVVPSNTIKKIEIKMPSGSYHKIDIYSDACTGNVIFHESGEGSVYEDE
ncbi:MAG: hypothetical protein KJ583_07165 [Nanoarchaeota archaeon]|nr:hypothetical protein [Nanoarchaeota archaeon]MBU1269191.1 hypothetical protein [Nanoarchaeota archaeon]MBU1605066.1 hypothetical protein [Nanoarchaeota archaeon]MBU2443003.1 hypothetical protein [Nanoarchaeota archaeon]